MILWTLVWKINAEISPWSVKCFSNWSATFWNHHTHFCWSEQRWLSVFRNLTNHTNWWNASKQKHKKTFSGSVSYFGWIPEIWGQILVSSEKNVTELNEKSDCNYSQVHYVAHHFIFSRKVIKSLRRHFQVFISLHHHLRFLWKLTHLRNKITFLQNAKLTENFGCDAVDMLVAFQEAPGNGKPNSCSSDETWTWFCKIL